jgi:hypothetical protein
MNKADLTIDHIRFVSTNEETAAKILINGKFECYVLEDQHNDKKVRGETRIPAGEYYLKLRTSNSTMHVQYGKKFPKFHMGMLEIIGIPNYGDVYYHIGNDDDDTLGCPLTGNRIDIRGQKITIAESTAAYEKFYPQIAPLLKAGKTVMVRIQDQDVNISN